MPLDGGCQLPSDSSDRVVLILRIQVPSLLEAQMFQTFFILTISQSVNTLWFGPNPEGKLQPNQS